MRSRSTRPLWLVTLALAVMAGCGSCGSGPSALRTDEPQPHVRCLAAEAPAEGTKTVGGIGLEIEGRTLTVLGPEAPIRFAAFAGPAPGRPDLVSALASVNDAGVAFVVVLGDFGDDAATLGTSLEAFAGLDLPVFLVPGGRDDATILAAGLDALSEASRSRIIDVSALDRIVVAGQSLLPVAGAPGGRYGRTDDACGFTASDLDARAERLGDGETSGRRYLLAWAAPTGGIAQGLAGADAGDEALGEFFDAVGASGGLYAWPREAVGRVLGGETDRSEVLRRIAGPVAVRGDGERPTVGPGYYSIGQDGLTSP